MASDLPAPGLYMLVDRKAEGHVVDEALLEVLEFADGQLRWHYVGESALYAWKLPRDKLVAVKREKP